jgi:hypothetical protein
MAEPNPDHWVLTHLRWLALSRWDNEGGASPSRPTSGRAGTAGRAGAAPATQRRDTRPPAGAARP